MAKKVQALIGKLKNGSGWDVQAILFNKKEWSNAEEREKGMVENDYKSGRYDLTETENDYRYDQMDMSLFKFLNVVPAPAPRESLPPDEDELDLTENYTEDENGSERRRVSFRMSPSLHRKLKEFASSKDLSTNQAACRAITQYLSQRGGTDNPEPREIQMAELRDLKEIRGLLEPEKDQDAISKVDVAIRAIALTLAGAAKTTPDDKGIKSAGKTTKWFERGRFCSEHNINSDPEEVKACVKCRLTRQYGGY